MDLWTRRKFLIASGVVGASALAAGGAVIGWQDLARGAATRPLAGGTPVLVLVTLYGGNDGLNTVVPAGDPAYRSARPDLAYSPDQVLDLGEGLGLNPALKGLHGLWGAEQLAVVRGVGYPQPSHSHFQSMDIWQTASPAAPASTGWLGRWLDAQGRDPLRAVSLGGTLPPLLAGATTSGSALPLGAFRLPTGPTLTSFTALGAPGADDPATLAAAATADRDLLTVAHTFGPVLDGLARTSASGASGAAGEGSLAQQLDVVAACVAARVPTRVYAVSLGGFDTHAGEKATQEQLLGQFDQAVTGFLGKVAHSANPVVLAAYSEFGRRVQANANQGTDHGTAAPLLVAGTSVKGGFQGAQPSLTDLDEGDLRFTTDFRSVYATLLHRVLGADPHQVLGQDFPQLDFV
ncbi:DUF1501 domain-containing protein [Streptacidiphilus jiangxiensis]|uniref:Uncharacterized conserved protein, DUF1501 family n=1 Tax=Streptacidiphilus jiangxiensis TaxID=235985 RepID=A0A1H7N917_STRJI|nr:DUF1501 domain-containing protein [Streptacidiphilus jiangxiensis]SEL19781.1 Uncharacterized conserved protein, DUF1501 family [Streptacidiphilus jiangxiensis]